MTASESSQDEKDAQKNAGLAGAGGGTLVAVIANQLPEGNIAKPTLNCLAPSISILVTALWVWLQVKIANYVRDKEVNQVIESAKSTLIESIKSPHISEEHRSYLRKQLEDLDSINIDRIKSKIKELKVITNEDIRGESQSKNHINLSESTQANES